MKTYFRLAPLTLAITAGSVMAQSNDEAVAQMQQQLNAMQQQLNSVKNERVRFNGFFSTGYSRASNDVGFAGVTEDSSVNDQSLLALQGTFDVTDKSQAVMQLVGRGAEDWDPVIEWAYLSHRPTNNLQLRAGKMRLPFFMYSDSLEVGYSQPWARPPQSVYGPIESTSYVGTDATYTINLDNSAITAQAFTGFNDQNTRSAETEFRNLVGSTLSWTNYVWTVRAVAATAESTVFATNLFEFISEDDRAVFLGLGLSYDDGSWQIISEVTRAETDGRFADNDSAYLSVGHRFGSVTPYVAVGWLESQDDDERTGSFAVTGAPELFLNNRRDEYSVGTRWDITPGVALKADITHVRGFEDSPGGLDQTYVLTNEKNSTNVYTLKLDSAF